MLLDGLTTAHTTNNRAVASWSLPARLAGSDPAGFVAQTGTGSAKIVRSKHDPDCTWSTPPSPLGNFSTLFDRPKHRPGHRALRISPSVHRPLDPGWEWHRPHMGAFPREVGDDPVIFSLL